MKSTQISYNKVLHFELETTPFIAIYIDITTSHVLKIDLWCTTMNKFIAYLTGFPGSGKLTVANQIANKMTTDVVVVDSHSLSNIVYHRCSDRISVQHDDYNDCKELTERLVGANYHSIFEELRSVAALAHNLAPVFIYRGENPSEAHHNLVDRIREIALSVIEKDWERNFIFTNKLYDNNPFHASLIEKIKQIASASTKKFYGFKINVPEGTLTARIANSDRQANGKLISAETIKREFRTHVLVRDPEFIDIDASEGSDGVSSLIVTIIENSISDNGLCVDHKSSETDRNCFGFFGPVM